MVRRLQTVLASIDERRMLSRVGQYGTSGADEGVVAPPPRLSDPRKVLRWGCAAPDTLMSHEVSETRRISPG